MKIPVKNLLGSLTMPGFLSLFAAAILLALFGCAAEGRAQDLKSVCQNIDQEPCVTAKKMILSASVMVLGEQPKGDDWTYMASRMLSRGEVSVEKFKSGINLLDAVKTYKSYLADPSAGDGTRYNVVKLAFQEVYGYFPNFNDAAAKSWMQKMSAGQAWYAPLVTQEIENLNKTESTRREMIKRAYQHAFGRASTTSENDYWYARKEHYRLLRENQRRWMYSEQGAKDLEYAVNAALKVKLKRPPTPQEFSAAMSKAKFARLIYLEMVPLF